MNSIEHPEREQYTFYDSEASGKTNISLHSAC